jgi:hypothetical protein
VVERSFAWLRRYRRLNTIVERSKEHLIAFVEIAFISIFSRRLKRLVVKEFSAQRLRTDGVDGPQTASMCHNAGCQNRQKGSRPQ